MYRSISVAIATTLMGRVALLLLVMPSACAPDPTGVQRSGLSSASYMVLGRAIVDPLTGLSTGGYADVAPAVIAAGGTVDGYYPEIGAVSALADDGFADVVAADPSVAGAFRDSGAQEADLVDGTFGPWSPFSNGSPSLVGPGNRFG